MTRRNKTLQDLIDKSGFSLADLAAAANLSLRGFLKLRRGMVRNPRATTIHGLAAALKIEEAAVRVALRC